MVLGDCCTILICELDLRLPAALALARNAMAAALLVWWLSTGGVLLLWPLLPPNSPSVEGLALGSQLSLETGESVLLIEARS